MKRHMPPWFFVLLAGLGFAVTIIAYYPGLLTFDSIWQFNQSVSGQYMDHHPPLMGWIWSLTNRVIPGPFGILLLQVSLMWLALLLIADGAARRGLRHAWIVIAIGFLPPIIGVEGEIWKDIEMAAALLFGAAIIYRASAGREDTGLIVAAIALIPIFYATAVRANAPAATGPILVYWARYVFRGMRLRAAILVGGIVLALMLGGQWIFENKFLQVRHAYISQFLEAWDLAAIRCAGGDVTIPVQFHRVAPDVRPLCEAFDSLKADFLFAPAGAPLSPSTDPEVIRELDREWRRAIFAYPSIYLTHRLRAFDAMLGVGTDEVRRPLWLPYSIPNPYGFTFVPNSITYVIGVGVGVARAIGLYNGRIWLAIAFAVCAFAAMRMRRGWGGDQSVIFAFALAASAITYTLPYFFITPSPDYRYLYWTVVATAVSAALTLLHWRPTVSR
jgi:hypothetical protein